MVDCCRLVTVGDFGEGLRGWRQHQRRLRPWVLIAVGAPRDGHTSLHSAGFLSFGGLTYQPPSARWCSKSARESGVRTSHSDRLRDPSARTLIGLRLVLSPEARHRPPLWGRVRHRPPVLRTGSASLGDGPLPRSRASALRLQPQFSPESRGVQAIGESTSRSPIRVRAEGARRRSLWRARTPENSGEPGTPASERRQVTFCSSLR